MTALPLETGTLTAPTPLLRVRGLRTDIALRHSVVHAVDGVDLTVQPGQTLGVVGESGCGKTTVALSLMRLLPPGGAIVGGDVVFDGVDLATLPEPDMRRLRGNDLAMIFQDPLSSLNPTLTVGRQLIEAVLLHRHEGHAAARRRALEVLDLVGIAQAASRIDDYPHQFSGGMRQRVMIAMALTCNPRLLIADEPTTALDVTIQAQILELIDRLRRELDMAVILVTHDLGVIAGHTDEVAVMYAGRVVETATTTALFEDPQHRYTEALLRALPEKALETHTRLHSIPGLPPDLSTPLSGCPFAPRCEFAEDDCVASDPPLAPRRSGGHVACLHPVVEHARLDPPEAIARVHPARPDVLLEARDLVKDFPLGGGLFGRTTGTVSAVAGVSLVVRRGQTLGLVGESGCGKTTTGRLLAGLDRPTSGSVWVDGQHTAGLRGSASRAARRAVQFMFQDSASALDPRMRVGAILREPLVIQHVGSRSSRRERVGELLDSVGLPRAAAERYPHEFSGGQRQRIGLARALALSPDVIVADEPVSALDVSIQAQVLNTIRLLQRDQQLTLVVISHDLAVIRYLADDIGVMYLGKLVELGPAEDVHAHPLHPYTRALIDTVPVADPARERAQRRVRLVGEPPSPVTPPSGCRFRTRCPLATDLCAAVEPPLRELRDGHQVACHFPLERAQLRAVGSPAATV